MNSDPIVRLSATAALSDLARRDLIRDVGIHQDNMEFFNVGDLAKKREQLFVHASDHNF